MRHHKLSKRKIVPCIMAATLAACIAGEAAAQSNVEVYGVIGVFAGTTKRSGAAEKTVEMGSGGLTTPFYGFRGQEDLGGGLKAVFRMENYFRADTGESGRRATDPVAWSKVASVGLSGNFGQLTLGRQITPYKSVTDGLNPYGASSTYSPLSLHTYSSSYGNTVIGDTIWSNAIQYKTNAMNGFTGTVMYGLGEKAGNTSVNNLGLSAQYQQGPLAVLAAAQRVRVDAVAPSTAQNAYVGGLSYDMGVAKLFAAAERTEKTVTDVKSRTYELGASIPTNPAGKVLLSWARTKNEVPRRADTARSTAALGYDHALSKRTDIYAVYLYDKLSTSGSGNGYTAGIRHAF
jgi:predicted porin